jgi:hypothetical protein
VGAQLFMSANDKERLVCPAVTSYREESTEGRRLWLCVVKVVDVRRASIWKLLAVALQRLFKGSEQDRGGGGNGLIKYLIAWGYH